MQTPGAKVAGPPSQPGTGLAPPRAVSPAVRVTGTAARPSRPPSSSSCVQCPIFEAKIVEVSTANEEATATIAQQKAKLDELLAKIAQKDREHEHAIAKLGAESQVLAVKFVQSEKEAERLRQELAVARGDGGVLENVNLSVQLVVSKMSSLEAHMMRLSDEVRVLRGGGGSSSQSSEEATTSSYIRSHSPAARAGRPAPQRPGVQIHRNPPPPPQPSSPTSSEASEFTTSRPRRLSIESTSSGSSSGSAGSGSSMPALVPPTPPDLKTVPGRSSIIPCEVPTCRNPRLVGSNCCASHQGGDREEAAAPRESRRGRQPGSPPEAKSSERRCRSPATRRTTLPLKRATASGLPAQKVHIPNDPDRMEYKEYEDVKDVSDPSGVLTRVLTNLVKGGDYWRDEFAALDDVRSLAKFHPDLLLPELTTVTNKMIEQMSNLRSSIVINCILAFKTLLACYGTAMDRCTKLVGVAIRKAVDKNNQFVVAEGDSLVDEIINAMSAKKVCKEALPLMADKDKNIRALASGVIFMSLDRFDSNDINDPAFNAELLKFIAPGLTDSLQECRTDSRNSLVVLKTKLDKAVSKVQVEWTKALKNLDPKYSKKVYEVLESPVEESY